MGGHPSISTRCTFSVPSCMKLLASAAEDLGILKWHSSYNVKLVTKYLHWMDAPYQGIQLPR